MRLIDADELLKQKDMMLSIREPNNWFLNPDEENYANYYIELNDINFWADENKVDAIPTKWIEKYIDHLTNEIEHGVECSGARKQLDGIKLMLHYWRKENE